MQLTIATIVACSPAEAWHAVQSVRLLQHITAPLIRFQPLDPPTFPITWADRAYKVRMWMFGLLPMGTHWIVISRAQHTDAHGAPVYELLDDGHGTLIKQWRHHITIAPAPKGETLYSDQVVIEAGWLTLPVWLYAQLFYRYARCAGAGSLAAASALFNHPSQHFIEGWAHLLFDRSPCCHA